MKILLTGFDPFGGESVNPALEAVKLAAAPEGAELIKLEVPTKFGAAIDTVTQAIRQIRPDAVLCIGQAGGRSAMTPERVAINVNDARIPDNGGYQPCDEPIVKDGPDAYFTRLPIKAMTAAMEAEGIPAQVSNTAGTFVCNHLMYGVLHQIRTEFPDMTGGFMHVPFIPEQTADKPAGTPSLPLETIARGIEISLQVIADGQK